MLVLSACDQLLNLPTSQGASEVTHIPASKDTPYIKTIAPSQTTTLEAISTPTDTVEITQKPIEIAPLTDEEEIQVLFEQGINDSNKSYPLVSAEDAESSIGKEATAESTKSMKDILNVLLSQGSTDIVIPAYAESVIDEVKGQYPDVNIVVSGKDEEGNVSVPEGYYSIESFGFSAGGYANFVRNPEKLWLVILPKGNKNVDDWILDPASNDVDLIQLKGQAAYGQPVFVKTPGASNFRLVQVAAGGKVIAILNRGINFDDYASKLWELQEIDIREVPFDKSNPQTITVEGTEYSGYQMGDIFGSRLVDDNNNIILVREGDVWKVAETKNYSEKYPAMYYETKIGNAEGFEIPVTLGLSTTANEGEGFYFTEAHMTQRGADDVVSEFLYDRWTRYVNAMKHPDTAYDEYLELLRQGKGNIEVIDSVTKKSVLIDPRQGISWIITGEGFSKMPVRNSDSYGQYLTSDEKGKLLYTVNMAYFYNPGDSSSFRDARVYYLTVSLYQLFFTLNYPDSCMVDRDLNSSCGQILHPENFDTTKLKLRADLWAYDGYESDDPLFTLR